MMQSTIKKSRLVPLLLALGIVSISFAAIFFKKAEPTHPLVSSALRLCFAALLLSPFLLKSILRGRMTLRQFRHALLAGLLYSIHFGTWVTSLTLTSIAASVTLVTTTPLLLGIIGIVSGRDRPDRYWWLSLGLAAGGLALISGGGLLEPGAIEGNLLALLGACAMAGYMLTARHLGLELDVPAFAAIATAVGAAILLCAAYASGIPIEAASNEALFYLLLAALIPQLIGHNTITWALRHTTPTVTGLAILGEPVGATLIAWLWLGQSIPPAVGGGCLLTLLAVGLAVLKRTGSN